MAVSQKPTTLVLHNVKFITLSRIHVDIVPVSINGLADADGPRGDGLALSARRLLVRRVNGRLVVNPLLQGEARGAEIELILSFCLRSV